MSDKAKIKLSVYVDTVQLPRSLCNPVIGSAILKFEYWGGGSITVNTLGLKKDQPVEILMDVKALKLINDFLLQVCEHDKPKRNPLPEPKREFCSCEGVCLGPMSNGIKCKLSQSV